MRRKMPLAALVSFWFFASACPWDSTHPTPACTASSQTYSYAAPTFTVAGAPVANFSFNQNYTSYSPALCKADQGLVNLSITSTAPVPLSFSYNLQGRGATGLIVWSYASTISRIAPGQTINVGQVVNTPVLVNLGVTILLSAITQVP